MRQEHGVQRFALGNAGRLQTLFFPLDRPVFFQDRLVLRIRNQTDPVADGAKALVCIVLSVQKPVLRARGHDPVRLVRALGHEIVNQRPDVAVHAL